MIDTVKKKFVYFYHFLVTIEKHIWDTWAHRLKGSVGTADTWKATCGCHKNKIFMDVMYKAFSINEPQAGYVSTCSESWTKGGEISAHCIPTRLLMAKKELQYWNTAPSICSLHISSLCSITFYKARCWQHQYKVHYQLHSMCLKPGCSEAFSSWDHTYGELQKEDCANQGEGGVLSFQAEEADRQTVFWLFPGKSGFYSPSLSLLVYVSQCAQSWAWPWVSSARALIHHVTEIMSQHHPMEEKKKRKKERKEAKRLKPSDLSSSTNYCSAY